MSSSLSHSMTLGGASMKSEGSPGYDLRGHSVTMCLIVCRSAPQSQFGESERPHLNNVSVQTPQLERIRLSRSHRLRGKSNPPRDFVGFSIGTKPVTLLFAHCVSHSLFISNSVDVNTAAVLKVGLLDLSLACRFRMVMSLCTGSRGLLVIFACSRSSA